MKKLMLVAVAALLMGVQANAQIVAKIGFIGGLDKTRAFDGYDGSDYMGLNGFAFGADYKIALPWVNGLGAEPGVYLDFLFGRKNNQSHADIAISLPLHASYTYDINQTISLIGLTGPTIQIGLLKNSTARVGDQVIRRRFYAPDNDITCNRFMLLYDISAGVELFGRVQITTGVDFGLTSFARTGDWVYRRPVQYKFMVGYMF